MHERLTERFAASGGVARPKGSGENQPLCLVASAVKPPPAASRQHVVRKRATAERQWEKKLVERQ
jgi:hypothetical protein